MQRDMGQLNRLPFLFCGASAFLLGSTSLVWAMGTRTLQATTVRTHAHCGASAKME